MYPAQMQTAGYVGGSFDSLHRTLPAVGPIWGAAVLHHSY